jgi:hypothetical protein
MGRKGLPPIRAGEYYFDNILKPDHLLILFIFIVFLKKTTSLG